MSSIYHIIYKQPKLYKHEMPIDLEYLANKLVQSGQLRIDAIDKINFAKFSIPNFDINYTFSYRQLYDPNLIGNTKSLIRKLYQYIYKTKNIENKVKESIANLKNELIKYQQVHLDLEMKLARILVQSTHPSVILLLLLERIIIYISYSYTIGDVMDIANWQKNGQNSGMQSTGNLLDNAIYVSCGGDPFGETNPEFNFGDGRPALARMMIISAQELGHYADIIRNSAGNYIGRYSSVSSYQGIIAKEKVRIARIKDINNITHISNNLNKLGIKKVTELERYIKFYRKVKKFGMVYTIVKIKLIIYKFIFKKKCDYYRYTNLFTIKVDDYLITHIAIMLKDMSFNLKPEADVYKRQNKIEEEAIQCIEALARVPQQAIKWGHIATKHLTPNLYEIYYKEVIPGCIRTYENITKTKYNINLKKKFPLYIRIYYTIIPYLYAAYHKIKDLIN